MLDLTEKKKRIKGYENKSENTCGKAACFAFFGINCFPSRLRDSPEANSAAGSHCGRSSETIASPFGAEWVDAVGGRAGRRRRIELRGRVGGVDRRVDGADPSSTAGWRVDPSNVVRSAAPTGAMRIT